MRLRALLLFVPTLAIAAAFATPVSAQTNPGNGQLPQAPPGLSGIADAVRNALGSVAGQSNIPNNLPIPSNAPAFSGDLANPTDANPAAARPRASARPAARRARSGLPKSGAPVMAFALAGVSLLSGGRLLRELSGY